VDFDELLDESRFASIEKIKTIGSTYMAVSGLDPVQKTATNVRKTSKYNLYFCFKTFFLRNLLTDANVFAGKRRRIFAPNSPDRFCVGDERSSGRSESPFV
jgi:hypothetical protein